VNFLVLLRRLSKFVLLSFLAGTAFPGQAASEETLEIITWPGAYGAALEQAIAIPFSERTGKKTVIKHYPHDDQVFRFEDFAFHGDVLDLEAKEALDACSTGKLLPLTGLRLADAPDQTPPHKDFYDVLQNDCAAPATRFSHVIAYPRTGTSRPPASITALFDLKRFPGQRGLRKDPQTLLVWAALAAGIPNKSVYDVLLTTGGVELVFEQLDLIRGHIIWWERLNEPISWLTKGEVAMASTFYPLVYQANREDPNRLGTLSEGQIADLNVWVIPNSAKNTETARAFIKHATSTRPLAAFSSLVPYGSVRRSSRSLIAGEMHRHMPSTPDTSPPSIQLDHRWWREHGDYLKKRFAAWAMADATNPEGSAQTSAKIPPTDE